MEIYKSLVLKTIVIFALLVFSGFPANTVSAASDLPQAGDFLTNPDCNFDYYLTASSSQRSTCRAGIKSRKYTHHYVDMTAEGFNGYTSVSDTRSKLQELVNDGIRVVIFLTSDTGSWKDQSISTIKSNLSSVIPQIDDLIDSYVLGIEVDEYWTEAEADEIGNHMQTLTSKKIADHQLPGKWNYCKGAGWCDYMFLQYGFGKSETEIKNMTTNAVNDLGKPVVAGEYSISAESTSVALGNAAQEKCAAGFGNGGTPSKILWPNCSATPTNTPTPTPKPTSTPAPTATPTPKPTATSAPTGSLITTLSVKDSTNADDWTIRTNLQVNDNQYGDRSYKLTSVPSWYSGSDWIRSANDSKAYTGNPLVTFRVEKDSFVYVAENDAVTSRPSWLADWYNTGDDLKNNESTPQTFSIYSRFYSAGTSVSLGPNGNTSSSLYTVVVKANKKGDATGDGAVDNEDYDMVWKPNYTKSTSAGPSKADFNNDGIVDGIDYTIWVNNYTS